MAFAANDTVLIIPKVDLGDVKEVISSDQYKVKCYSKCEDGQYHEKELDTEPTEARRLNVSDSFFYIVKSKKNKSGKKSLARKAYTASGSRIKI